MRRGDVSSCSRAEGRRSEDTRPFSGAQADRATDESGPAPPAPRTTFSPETGPPSPAQAGPWGQTRADAVPVLGPRGLSHSVSSGVCSEDVGRDGSPERSRRGGPAVSLSAELLRLLDRTGPSLGQRSAPRP